MRSEWRWYGSAAEREGSPRIGAARQPNNWRIPVECDPTRMCELLVGLGDVEVLCQWPVGSARWRTAELPSRGQQNCPVADS